MHHLHITDALMERFHNLEYLVARMALIGSGYIITKMLNEDTAQGITHTMRQNIQQFREAMNILDAQTQSIVECLNQNSSPFVIQMMDQHLSQRLKLWLQCEFGDWPELQTNYSTAELCVAFGIMLFSFSKMSDHWLHVNDQLTDLRSLNRNGPYRLLFAKCFGTREQKQTEDETSGSDEGDTTATDDCSFDEGSDDETTFTSAARRNERKSSQNPEDLMLEQIVKNSLVFRNGEMCITARAIREMFDPSNCKQFRPKESICRYRIKRTNFPCLKEMSSGRAGLIYLYSLSEALEAYGQPKQISRETLNKLCDEAKKNRSIQDVNDRETTPEKDPISKRRKKKRVSTTEQDGNRQLKRKRTSTRGKKRVPRTKSTPPPNDDSVAKPGSGQQKTISTLVKLNYDNEIESLKEKAEILTMNYNAHMQSIGKAIEALEAAKQMIG